MTPRNHSRQPDRAADRPRVSVVVPVRNGAREIVACLDALLDSHWPLHEILVIDDASTDETAEIARGMGATVFCLDENRGPACARNQGAQRASGEILFFTDADVTVHRDTIARAVHCLQADPALAAVIGSYDETPSSPDFVAQYKNLFHHWVHQHGHEDASTFWTGCGAIRRDVFLDAGGFHEGYPKPSIEDIELGFRLRAAGQRIRMEKRMLATHSKRWRLGNLIHTDVFLRGVPWIALMLRDRHAPQDLNLSKASKFATAFAVLCALALVGLVVTGRFAALLPTLGLVGASWFSAQAFAERPGRGRAIAALTIALGLPALGYWLAPDPLGLLPLGLWLLTAATHPDLYAFFAARRGIAFAVGIAPLHLIFQWCCALSVPLGILEYFRNRHAARRGRIAPAVRQLAPLECHGSASRRAPRASAGSAHV